MAEEHVLTVPTPLFHGLGHFQGFSDRVDHYVPTLLAAEHAVFLPRSAAEDDPTHKQLIPYVVFRSGDRLFAYTRGKGQGEKRLHAKMSIGVGGHIAREDATPSASPYETGMARELAEEVRIDSAFVSRCIGLINDDDTPVGQVHLGIVHLYELAEPQITPLEDGFHDAGFFPIAELLANFDRFETWSQIALKALYPERLS